MDAQPVSLHERITGKQVDLVIKNGIREQIQPALRYTSFGAFHFQRGR